MAASFLSLYMITHPCEAHTHEQALGDAHQLSEPQAVVEEEVMLQGQSLGSVLCELHTTLGHSDKMQLSTLFHSSHHH